MKNFSAKVLIAAIMICSASAKIAAQEYIPTPVTISTNKVKVDGKVCYSHIVLERQTIYSICKAYNVSAEDLYKFNPGLEENGLKKNSIIIIPSSDALAEKEETTKEVKEKKETKEVKEVKEEKIEEKSEEKIETKKEGKSKSSQKLRKHTVKWYESLDDIAQKYGVTKEAIIELNNIQDPSNITRMKLQIPNAVSESEKQEEKHPSDEGSSTTTVDVPDTSELVKVEVADSLKAERPDTISIVDSTTTIIEEKPRTSINFALLLPMAATGTTSKVNYMDFYCGVLYALYTSSKEGISTDLRVFDSANDATPETEFFNDCDFAIGPVYTKDFENIMDKVPENFTIISPLDHRVLGLTKKHTNLVQAPTHRKYQYEELVKWIKDDLQETDNILYISETNTRDTVAVNEMKEVLKASGLDYKEFSYTILQGRGIGSALRARMTKTGINRIIIESESEAWVNDLVRNLSIISRGTKITLYSPSKIRTFESIDAENLYKISLHVCLSYNINYDNALVKDFLLKYRAIFHTEPSLFAFQGYDLARYFIHLVHQYGKEWKEHITEAKMSGLQATFDFQQNENEGVINKGVRKVQYFPNGKAVDIESDFQ